MYQHAQIDLNMLDQEWFDGLDFYQKSFMMWLIFQINKSAIGMVDVNLRKFSKYTDGMITERDLDVFAFVEAVNRDKPDRMIFLDRGKRLMFTPTIIFKGCDMKTGIRKFTTSWRDIPIFKASAARS